MGTFKNVLLGALVAILLGQLACTQVLLYKAFVSPSAPGGHGEPVEIRIVTEAPVTEPSSQPTALVQTGNPFDWAIEGKGYFEVKLPDGTQAYTRDGKLKIDQNGEITTMDGYFLRSKVTIPTDCLEVIVTYDGVVTGLLPRGTPVALGAVQLVGFVNPAGLDGRLGQNLLLATETSGQPVPAQPGQDGLGTIAQGFLERPKPGATNEGAATLTLLVQPGGKVIPLSVNEGLGSSEGV